MTAIAKMARSGRTRCTSRQTRNIVPRLANAARIWNPRIWLCTLLTTPVVSTEPR